LVEKRGAFAREVDQQPVLTAIVELRALELLERYQRQIHVARDVPGDRCVPFRIGLEGTDFSEAFRQPNRREACTQLNQGLPLELEVVDEVQERPGQERLCRLGSRRDTGLALKELTLAQHRDSEAELHPEIIQPDHAL